MPTTISISLLLLPDYIFMMPRSTAVFLGENTLISLINRQQCWAWTTRIQNWTVLDQWSSIVFCDDPRFGLSSDDNRGGELEVTWRKIIPKFYVFTDQDQCFHNGVGLNEYPWIGSTLSVKRNINHQKYIDVLESSFLSCITNMFRDVNHSFLFQ